MTRHAWTLGAAALAASLLAASAQASTWDATQDFSTSSTSNPNGVWSYGRDPADMAGYQFKAFDTLGYSDTLLYWSDSSYLTGDTPHFGKNMGAVPRFGVLPGQLTLHPGITTTTDDAAILRFTAPASGLYAITAQLFDGGNGETDVWFVRNGDFSNPLATLGVSSANPGYSASGVQLAAGDTLDLVVGNHGSYFGDSTPFSLQISNGVSVPEPGTIPLLAASFVLLAGFSRRRRS